MAECPPDSLPGRLHSSFPSGLLPTCCQPWASRIGRISPLRQKSSPGRVRKSPLSPDTAPVFAPKAGAGWSPVPPTETPHGAVFGASRASLSSRAAERSCSRSTSVNVGMCANSPCIAVYPEVGEQRKSPPSPRVSIKVASFAFLSPLASFRLPSILAADLYRTWYPPDGVVSTTSREKRPGSTFAFQPSYSSPWLSKSMHSRLPDTDPATMHTPSGWFPNHALTSYSLGNLPAHVFHAPTDGRFSALMAGSTLSPAERYAIAVSTVIISRPPVRSHASSSRR